MLQTVALAALLAAAHSAQPPHQSESPETAHQIQIDKPGASALQPVMGGIARSEIVRVEGILDCVPVVEPVPVTTGTGGLTLMMMATHLACKTRNEGPLLVGATIVTGGIAGAAVVGGPATGTPVAWVTPPHKETIMVRGTKITMTRNHHVSRGRGSKGGR